jgi:hypothetical protein
MMGTWTEDESDAVAVLGGAAEMFGEFVFTNSPNSTGGYIGIFVAKNAVGIEVVAEIKDADGLTPDDVTSILGSMYVGGQVGFAVTVFAGPLVGVPVGFVAGVFAGAGIDRAIAFDLIVG